MTTTSPATDTTPRVWIGCLACYNEGRLVGDWYDAETADEVTTYDIHGPHSRADSHDELWCFDHENIPVRGELDPATARAAAAAAMVALRGFIGVGLLSRSWGRVFWRVALIILCRLKMRSLAQIANFCGVSVLACFYGFSSCSGGRGGVILWGGDGAATGLWRGVREHAASDSWGHSRR